jgi:hypothetical protein
MWSRLMGPFFSACLHPASPILPSIFAGPCM